MKLCREGCHEQIELEMSPHVAKRVVMRLDVFPSIDADSHFLGSTILIENTTIMKQVKDHLQHQLAIEQLISNISTRFISINDADMDKEIVNVLKIVCEIENARECSIENLQSSQIKSRMKYCSFNEKLAAEEKYQRIDQDGFETVFLTIVIKSETLGYFKFSQEKYRDTWFDNDSQLILLIGEIIINALIRKENEQNIKLNENRLATTLHSIGDAVIATDPEGQIVLMNRMAEVLTGWSWEQARGNLLNKVFSPVVDNIESIQKMREFNSFLPMSETDNSLLLTSKDGQLYYISVNSSRIEDAAKNFYGEVTVFRDVTKSKHENDEIRYISYHDKLTGLYNRTFFEEEMQRLNTRRQFPITIILGDCNGLKIANDIFGHLEGDRLLQSIANIIRRATRHEDIVARWGGDEFAIIMPQTDEKIAAEVRERILGLCANSELSPIKPSLAMGCATATDTAVSPIELLKLAEDRMYRHKLMEAKSNRNSLISSIEKMVYEKSYETEEHANRLSDLSKVIGRAVGLSEFEMEELSLLSVLHDIGKIGIPDQILLKNGPLTGEEWEIMRKHSEKGYNLAKETPELQNIADAILHHHERWDGSGYPAGLSGDKIPKLSRILTIIDTYDVITHSRSYKLAQSSDDALKEIQNCAGSQFDPEMTKVFVDIMTEKLSNVSGHLPIPIAQSRNLSCKLNSYPMKGGEY